MKVLSNGLQIEVQDSATESADPDHARRPVVLLVIGLGLQLVDWPESFVQALLDAGYRVVRFDNRDAGLSTHLPALGKPNMFWTALQLKMGMAANSPYTLGDMTADTIGVLDALHIQRAHVLGMSMGGMIAQRMALAVPARVLSLTSMLSSSGAQNLPGPQGKVLRAMMASPRGNSDDDFVAQYFHLFKLIGSTTHATPDAELREQIRRSVVRSRDPVGIMRQMVAVATDIERAAMLHRITAPTLVLHGKADPLLPYACAQDTARRIPGAKLVGIDGLGHDMPTVHMATMLVPLLEHLRNAQIAAAPSAEVAQ
jgi:pimeloyl-ACP methyl ester carboxylesterase